MGHGSRHQPERAFEGAALADPDVSQDTSSVTTLAYTFARTLADPDVSGWDISSVETLQGTFYQAANANPDVAGWDTMKRIALDLSAGFVHSQSSAGISRCDRA